MTLIEIQNKHEELVFDIQKKRNFAISITPGKSSFIELETAHIRVANICKDFKIPPIYGVGHLKGTEFLYSFNWNEQGFNNFLECKGGILIHEEGLFTENFKRTGVLDNFIHYDPNGIYPNVFDLTKLIYQYLYYFLILKKK